MTAPGDQQAAFLAAIRDNPNADGPRLLFADWLAEQGDPRGELLHIRWTLIRLTEDDPRRDELQQRETELLARHGLDCFLDAIRDDPTDDVPRLLFADWLKARGDPRGELIQVQRALERSDRYDPGREELQRRETELLVQHGAAWRGDPPRGVQVGFQGGMLSVTVDPKVLARAPAPEWFLAQQSWVYALELQGVTDESLRRLIERGLLAKVVALSPRSNRHTDVNLDRLAGLKHLRELRLNDRWVTDEAAEGLAALTQLRLLDLSWTAVRDAGMRHLAGLTRLQTLRTGSGVTDVGVRHLAGLTQLQSLILGGTRLTDAGLAHLAGLTQLRDLHAGTIASTHDGHPVVADVTDAGVEHLAGMTQLRDLSLIANRVADAGLAVLAGLKELRTLDLRQTQVTGTGLKHLAGLTRLRELDLGESRVTGPGLEALTALPQLRRLSLHRTPVRDASLEHLAGLKQLRWLSLGDTRVSDAAVRELHEALPSCQIGR